MPLRRRRDAAWLIVWLFKKCSGFVVYKLVMSVGAVDVKSCAVLLEIFAERIPRSSPVGGIGEGIARCGMRNLIVYVLFVFTFGPFDAVQLMSKCTRLFVPL